MRLATLAEEKEITVTLGDIMAMDWVNGNRYVEALEICREILQSGEDYWILGTIARAEQTLGFCKGSLGALSTSFKTLPKR